MTDALTKYVELVPLPNKEANTVANAIFNKWYCRFGAPLDIVTDQGKEFWFLNEPLTFPTLVNIRTFVQRTRFCEDG